MPETTIVIRTKNEEKWLGAVLKKLHQQTYKNFEIIIVDSGSSDGTLEIAARFPVKIFQIPPGDFSYPYALNYGIARSAVTRFALILSAHSLPISNTWLEDGLSHFKEHSDVAGVYGWVASLPDATFFDKVFQDIPILAAKFFRRKKIRIITESGMGVLGFTNAIIRKDLWEKHHFNEAYGAGGEDGEWVAYWLSRGFKIICDPRFTVMHSHYLGLFGWLAQWRNWESLSHPRPFKPLAFRKSNTHAPIK